MPSNTPLETSPWIANDLSVWKDIIHGRTPALYRKNSFLFHQGDPAAFAYIIQSGRVRITCFHPEGMEKQLYIAECGCICGESASICGHPHFASALAIVDTLIYKISAGELVAQMKKNWPLNLVVFQSVGRKNTVFQNQVLQLSFLQAIQRVAHLLLNLCHQYGSSSSDGCRISIHFTHSDAALMINASRVTVSNIFNLLTEHGYLLKKDGNFIVTNLDFMEQLAEGAREL